MPNRMLSGEIARSESLSKVSLQAVATFTFLISVADDFGRFDGRPQILLAALFPLRIGELTTAQLEAWLEELVREDLIRWYTVDGRRYVELPGWRKHQRVRAARSKYPEPPAAVSEMLTDAATGGDEPSDDRDMRADDSGSTTGDGDPPASAAVVEDDVGVEDEDAKREDPAAGAADDLEPLDPRAPEVTFTRDFVSALRRVHGKTIDKRIPGEDTKRFRQRWVGSARLLFADAGEPCARSVAKWLFKGTDRDATFWRANVLSVSKFREQFPTLRMQMENAARASPRSVRGGGAEDALAELGKALGYEVNG